MKINIVNTIRVHGDIYDISLDTKNRMVYVLLSENDPTEAKHITRIPMDLLIAQRNTALNAPTKAIAVDPVTQLAYAGSSYIGIGEGLTNPEDFGVAILDPNRLFTQVGFIKLPIPSTSMPNGIEVVSMAIRDRTLYIGSDPYNPNPALRPQGTISFIDLTKQSLIKSIENSAPGGPGISNFAFIGSRMYFTNHNSHNIVGVDTIKQEVISVTPLITDEFPNNIEISERDQAAYVFCNAKHSSIKMFHVRTDPPVFKGEISHGRTLVGVVLDEVHRYLYGADFPIGAPQDRKIVVIGIEEDRIVYTTPYPAGSGIQLAFDPEAMMLYLPDADNQSVVQAKIEL